MDIFVAKRLLGQALIGGLLMALVGFGLFACGPVVQPTAIDPSPTAAVLAATDTPAPQPTPTPTSITPLAILLAPSGAEPALVEALLPALEARASQAGMRLESRQALSPGELLPEVRLVVSLPPAANLAELAAAAPQTQFIALSSSGLQAAENLSVIQLPGNDVEQSAFIAGYLAGALAEDWRIGLLLAQGDPQSAALRTAYDNGLAFLCGLCLPVYPPFPLSGYPIVIELADPADQGAWEVAIGELRTWDVQVVYVAASAASPALYQALAQADFQMIGIGAPPQGVQAHWVASLGGQDVIPILDQAWDTATNGQPGRSFQAGLALTHINPELLSPGRQQWVEQMLADLAAGYIDIGAATGAQP